MVTILNKLLSLTWLGDVADAVNGNKTLVGLVAIVVHMLNIAPTYFPEYGMAPQVAEWIQKALLYMGVLLPVGAAHKVVKVMDKKGE